MPALGNRNGRDGTILRQAALAELQSRLNVTHQREQAREDRFLTWQTRWADTKGQLIRRMDVIDEQLARLAQDEQTSPQLTIVRGDFYEEP